MRTVLPEIQMLAEWFVDEFNRAASVVGGSPPWCARRCRRCASCTFKPSNVR